VPFVREYLFNKFFVTAKKSMLNVQCCHYHVTYQYQLLYIESVPFIHFLLSWEACDF